MWQTGEGSHLPITVAQLCSGEKKKEIAPNMVIGEYAMILSAGLKGQL